jgi:hypothetical protein
MDTGKYGTLRTWQLLFWMDRNTIKPLKPKLVQMLFKNWVRTSKRIPHFTIFFPEGGVGLVPKRGCLLTLAYYAFPRWYEFGERRWNDILTGENRRTRRKTCPSASLSTTNPTWIDSCANPGLRGERPSTNYLGYGTAYTSLLQRLTG